MASEMRETRTQPQSTVTDCPSVRVIYIVVERPKGTAMMAKELGCVSSACKHRLQVTDPMHIIKIKREISSTHSPSTLNILRFLGNSLAYPIFASAASALGSLLPLATDALRPAPVWVMLMLRLWGSSMALTWTGGALDGVLGVSFAGDAVLCLALVRGCRRSGYPGIENKVTRVCRRSRTWALAV